MKLKSVILITTIALLFNSCFFEPLDLPSMEVKIEKQNLAVSEKTEITCLLFDILYDKNGQTDFFVYFKGLPKDCKIIDGDIYEPWTDDVNLCVIPVQVKGKNGKIVMEIAFDKPGQYELIANSCYTSYNEIGNLWTEGFYSYKFIVTE